MTCAGRIFWFSIMLFHSRAVPIVGIGGVRRGYILMFDHRLKPFGKRAVYFLYRCIIICLAGRLGDAEIGEARDADGI